MSLNFLLELLLKFNSDTFLSCQLRALIIIFAVRRNVLVRPRLLQRNRMVKEILFVRRLVFYVQIDQIHVLFGVLGFTTFHFFLERAGRFLAKRSNTVARFKRLLDSASIFEQVTESLCHLIRYSCPPS